MANQIIAAAELARNSRVVLDLDEMAYLVDSVCDTSAGRLRVTFSSGDVKVYGPREPVVVAV